MTSVAYSVEIEAEDLPVRGNYMASGDDAFDQQCEDEVIAKLDRGDIEAWCYVKVTAELAGFRGTAGIGGCTLGEGYTAEQCAVEHGLYAEALADLRATLKHAAEAGSQAQRLLADLEGGAL